MVETHGRASLQYLCEKFKKYDAQDNGEEQHGHDGEPRDMLVVLVVAAFVGPLAVQLVGEILAVVVRRFLFVRGIEARFVIELAGFGFIEIEQCHNRLFLGVQRYGKKMKPVQHLALRARFLNFPYLCGLILKNIRI